MSVHTFAAKNTELKQRKRKYEEAARALDKRERKVARNEIKAAALIEEGNTYLVEKTNEGDKLIKAKRAKAATILAAAEKEAAKTKNVANDYFMERTAEADKDRAAAKKELAATKKECAKIRAATKKERAEILAATEKERVEIIAATHAWEAKAVLHVKAHVQEYQEKVNAEGTKYLQHAKQVEEDAQKRSWLDDVDVSLLEN